MISDRPRYIVANGWNLDITVLKTYICKRRRQSNEVIDIGKSLRGRRGKVPSLSGKADCRLVGDVLVDHPSVTPDDLVAFVEELFAVRISREKSFSICLFVTRESETPERALRVVYIPVDTRV